MEFNTSVDVKVAYATLNAFCTVADLHMAREREKIDRLATVVQVAVGQHAREA